MYYGKITNCDISNGPGVRVSLFVSGCRNHCDGCFQPETWDFKYGEPFTKDVEYKIIKMLAPTYIQGLTVLGGDPFEPENQRDLVEFLQEVKNMFPSKTIWMYSGYAFETLVDTASHVHCEATLPILNLIDVLVDGPFIEGYKDISLAFRGSSNQRIINVPKSLYHGKVITLGFEYEK